MIKLVKFKHFFATSLGIIFFLTACNQEESSLQVYLPQPDDEAIIYTFQFKQQHYAEGKKTVVEEFSKIIEQSEQTRRTYYLTKADSAEVIAITFFHPEHSAKNWLSNTEKKAIIAQLVPLCQRPVKILPYHIGEVSNTTLNEKGAPNYLPEEGDRVILFDHLFSDDTFEEGKNIIEVNFPKAQKNSGQIRRNYFLTHSGDKQIVTASFFHPESSTTEWLNREERMEVLNALTPLFKRPIIVTEYLIEEIHNSK